MAVSILRLISIARAQIDALLPINSPWLLLELLFFVGVYQARVSQTLERQNTFCFPCVSL